MPNTTISDDDIKNAILSTNGTAAYLIKIIQNNNVCAVLYGHNVSNNYRFYVAFSYYSIGRINRIKSFKYNISSWTIESYVTNSDLQNIQSGVIEIPANSTSITVPFKTAYKQDPIVVATGKFIYKKNIICSLASVGKSSFDIYPIDTSTNNPPTDKSVFNWIAIGM